MKLCLKYYWFVFFRTRCNILQYCIQASQYTRPILQQAYIVYHTIVYSIVYHAVLQYTTPHYLVYYIVYNIAQYTRPIGLVYSIVQHTIGLLYCTILQHAYSIHCSIPQCIAQNILQNTYYSIYTMNTCTIVYNIIISYSIQAQYTRPILQHRPIQCTIVHYTVQHSIVGLQHSIVQYSIYYSIPHHTIQYTVQYTMIYTLCLKKMGHAYYTS